MGELWEHVTHLDTTFRFFFGVIIRYRNSFWDTLISNCPFWFEFIVRESVCFCTQNEAFIVREMNDDDSVGLVDKEENGKVMFGFPTLKCVMN